jgi:hypothetical protein
LDPDRLVSGVDMDVADLSALDRWIPAEPAARLLQLSAQLSGCADFGLRLAGLRQLGMLGPLSMVLRDEPTLRPALELLIRFAPSYDEAVHMRMRGDDQLTTLAVARPRRADPHGTADGPRHGRPAVQHPRAGGC